ncbi:MAG: sulfurtransferase [Gemmatimonadetes bacterium]|nr:sulfurtransferase [Gemmatimonadota bacterium]
MRSPVRALLACTLLAALPAAVSAQFGFPTTLLVSPAQVARGLQDPKLVILQVGPPEEYEAGHVPGARLVSLNDISAPRTPNGLALELPTDSALRERLEKWGISDDSKVLVVGGGDWGSPATRLVFTLQVAGLAAQTRFLEGGATAWKTAKLPVTTDAPPTPARGHLTYSFDRSFVVSHEWVQAHANASRVRLVDARTPEFYEGPPLTRRDGHVMPVGHIAGARNIPFNTLFNDSLQFLPRDSLRRIFTAAGIQPGDTVAAYCHVGQQATMVLFSARLLGHPIRLYDGSMDDWTTRNLPLVNLAATAKGTP